MQAALAGRLLVRRMPLDLNGAGAGAGCLGWGCVSWRNATPPLGFLLFFLLTPKAAPEATPVTAEPAGTLL